jgi:protein-tyrosine phosphatase
MIDIHCHILPGVDDGSRSWDVTREMCEQALNDGVEHIVATPHANFRYAYDRAKHGALLDELCSRVPSLQFSIGCDFHLSSENIEDALLNPNRYTVGDSRYLLVEYSEYITRHAAEDPIRRLTAAGFIPIITHPERNPMLVRHPEIVEALTSIGALVQVTANSLTGFWGARSRKMGLDLLKRGLVHFIASDAHDTRHRTTMLSAAVKVAASLIGDTAATRLVVDNPRKLVYQPTQSSAS